MTRTTEPRTGAATPPGSSIDRYFGITAQGSTITRELRAGFTTWLTMSYILFVNPQVLLPAIPVPNAFVQLLMATCLAAAFGSLAMASWPATRSPRPPAWA